MAFTVFARPRSHQLVAKTIALRATNDGPPEKKTSKSARDQGIYARPSAAIERGSGFFIPGLEGSRIRFLFGITVLVADAANHVLVGSRPGDVGQTVAETTSAFYGAFLLLQGSIELAAEKGLALQGAAPSLETDSNVDDSVAGNEGRVINDNGEIFSDALSGDTAAKDSIKRLAETIINFTPATYFCFVDEDLGVLYSSGANSNGIEDGKNSELIKASLDAISESRGGRVALPKDHPASILVPESARRCILIQKAAGLKGGKACFVVGSDRLLPSFTKNDLRWIGQLAEFNIAAMDSR